MMFGMGFTIWDVAVRGGGTAVGIVLDVQNVHEAASVSTVVGTFSIANATGNWLDQITYPITYTITDDAGGLFGIDGDALEVAGALDYETAAFHEITLEADNGTDAPISRTLTITVNVAIAPGTLLWTVPLITQAA